MKAMLLEKTGGPLVYTDVPDPVPNAEQVLLRVLACGVCRTDLHVLDGELAHAKPRLILGHEIIGEVIATGAKVQQFAVGERVGVPWLGWTCGECYYCQTGSENLCDNAMFTGYQIDGGYAELTLADQRYCFPVDKLYSNVHAAPLLCAGLIGYRALKMAGDAQELGIYGFGAAAHIVTQLAVQQGRDVYAFTRENDLAAQQFALQLGAVWAGASTLVPPRILDAALIFAPLGDLVPAALQVVSKGSSVICAGIHMSDIPAFPYALLWGERVLRSVANLTRADGLEFLAGASQAPVQTHCVVYPLSQANQALADLRAGRFSGAAVLVPDGV